MRIQFAAPLKDRFGEDLEEADARNPGKRKKVSLGDVCCFVLDQQQQSDTNAKEKVRRWELIQAITKADHNLTPLEVLDSDVEMLKERILASTFPASLCGSAIQLLSPAVELFDERKKQQA